MRKWLKDARVGCQITMAELSQKLDISESYYCSIESGARMPRMDLALAAKISVILGISLPKIIEFEEELLREKSMQSQSG